MLQGEQSNSGGHPAEGGTGTDQRPEIRSPRALFAQRFAELYETAGNPTLRRVAAAASTRMRAAQGSRPGGASAQRISDWKAGRNVPARFESLLPVVLTLVELARKAGQPLPRPLAEPKEWQRLWHAATTWAPEDEDESACPYLGLTSYTSQDRALFFGRTRATAELTTLVREATGIVAVIGASGAGKSSLLAAGLAPALADWEIIALTPGPHPLATLMHAVTPAEEAPQGTAATTAVTAATTATTATAATAATAEVTEVTEVTESALSGAGRATPMASEGSVESADEHDAACAGNLAPHPDRPRRIVILDQFEELFSLCADESEYERFLDLLHSCASRAEDPIAVVLAVRADFYAHCLNHPVLQEALEHRSFLLGPMRMDELAQAITGPAQAAGLELEPGLEELVITELCGVGEHRHGRSYDPGALPLLSHVMAATWQQREGRKLTVQGYRKAGGVVGSVAETAEHAWNELSEAQRRAAKDILLGLVAVSQDSRDTRRTAQRQDLLGRATNRDDATAAMELLSRTRLITLDAETVTLTHEIVLRAWPRLHGWINEDRVGYLIRQRLEDDAAQWAAHERDSSRLYRGSLLQQALDHAEPPPVGDLSREFLTASTASRNHANRRSTRTKVALAVLGVILLVLGFAAYTQTRLAEQQRDDKTFLAVLDQADQLRQPDPSLAAQLYLVAEHLRPGDEQVRTRLLQTQNMPLVAATPGHSDGIYELVNLPGRGVLASIAYDRTLRLWGTGDNLRPRQLGSTIDNIGRVVFSPDGQVMVTTTPGGNLRIWDVTDPAAPRELASRPDFAGESAYRSIFAGDGRTLVTATPQRLTLWNLRNPATPVPGPSYPVRSGDPRNPHMEATIGPMRASPDGKLLALSYYAESESLKLWRISDTAVVTPVGEIDDKSALPREFAFSPDGRFLAVGSGTNAMKPLGDEKAAVQLWEISDPAHPQQVGQPLRTTENSVSALAFSPDGQLLAVAGTESASLWNVTEPAYPARIENPLSTSRATCHFGETSRPCAGGPMALVFTADGRTLAAAGEGGEILMWSLPPAHLYGHAGWTYQPNFDASGERMVTHSSDGRIIVWDIRDQSRPQRIGEYRVAPALFSTTLSPDGRTLLLTYLSPSSTHVVDLSDPAHIRPLGDWELRLGSLGYTGISNDWRLLATNHDDRTIRLWDISDRAHPTPIGTPLPVSSKYAWPRFAPDNRTLLVQELGESTQGFVVSRWDISDLYHPKRFDLMNERNARDNLMRITPDFRTMVIVANETIQSWDISDLERPAKLGEPVALHSLSVNTLSFTSDSRTMITTSSDDTAQLWDFTDPAHPRRVGGPLTEHSDIAWLAGFVPGDKFAFTTGAGGSIRLWDLDESHAVDRICAVTGTLWTPELWKRYLPQLPYSPPCG